MGKPRLLIEALYSYGGDREDRLTEVLASVLEVHEAFCQKLAERLGLASQPARFTVETQFGPAGQRRLVDMVLRGEDAQGEPVATVFVENKYNPRARLEAYWFDEDQAERQRRAVNSEPAERVLSGIASQSDLDLLDGPTDTRPRFDPRLAYDRIISWADVRAIAFELTDRVRAEGQDTSPTIPAADRLLLEFLTYLDLEGDAMGALGNDDLFVLARFALALDRVDRLLYKATESLAAAISPIDGSEPPVFERDEDTEVDSGVYYSALPPEATWLQELRDGEIYVMVGLDDEEGEDAAAPPSLYAGVIWNAGREGKQRITGSKWEARAREASLVLDWDRYTVSLSAVTPLRAIADGGNTLAQQAKLVAEWAQESITTVLRLPGPPDGDLDEDDDGGE